MSFCKFASSAIALLLGLLSASNAIAAEPVRITTDGVNKRDPQFINKGETLIYCVDDGPDLIRMLRMDMADGTTTPLFEDAGNKHQLEPSFSLDGKYVAFTECTGNLTARLVIRDIAAKKDSAITHSGRGGTRSPIFSPDGKRVVYAFAETGPQQLWSVTVDGQDKKQLTGASGITNWPSFTPDGRTIVFANSRENNYELYSMSIDGRNERRLTFNTLMDIRPVVSPDGRQVAFVSTRSGNYDVYVMNIDGSNVRRLTSSEERDDYPAWHPNGRQLVVVSEREGEFDLYLVDVAGTAVARR